MTTFFLIAASTLSIAASPALANEARPAAPAATTEQAEGARVAQPKQQRYCIVQPVTGSILMQRTCQTRAQWLSEGFDPLAKAQ